MNAGIKAIVPFFGRVVAEILLCLVPNRQGFAFDDQVGLLVIRRTVFGVGHVQAEGGGLVAVTTAVAAHILPDGGVIELHDGESWVLLHELPCISAWRHVNSHRRTVVAQIVSDAAPTDSHRVALRAVAAAKDEVFGEPREAILLERFLNVKSGQFVVFLVHSLCLLFLFLMVAAGGQQ